MDQSSIYGPCPALGRGLALLAVLSDGQPRRLEWLVRTAGFPKSSLLRMLETLCRCELVSREADGQYRALKALVPLQGEQWEARRQRTLQALATQTGQTAEWWELQDGNMVLVAQEWPSAEIRVQARLGYTRSFTQELEAVAVAGAALHGVKVGAGCWRNGPGLRRVKLSPAKAKSIIAAAAPTNAAADPFCNTNGVRRFARGVRAVRPGVLAVAAFVPYGGTLDESWIETHLATAAATLPVAELPASPKLAPPNKPN